MAKVYSDRAGITLEEAAAMMDDETWIGADEAIELGFAEGHLDGRAITKDAKQTGGRKALALVEAAMAKAGHSRSMRRDTLRNLFSGKPSAADPAMPSAGDDYSASLRNTLTTLTGATQ